MAFCIICVLRKAHLSYRQTTPDQQRSSLPDLTTELEDSRKFSLNLLMTLTGIIAASRSVKTQPLQLVVLMLLIYTINLHLSINTCFLRNYPTLSGFLHVIPLLGTSCMAGVVLVSDLQSPAVATICLLLGVLPLVTITIHHGRFCGEASTAGLPMQMQDVPGPGAALPGSAGTVLAPNGAD